MSSTKLPLAYCQKGHLMASALVVEGELRIYYSAAVATPDRREDWRDHGTNYVAHQSHVIVEGLSEASHEIMCPKNHGAQINFHLTDLLPVVRGKASPLTIKV